MKYYRRIFAVLLIIALLVTALPVFAAEGEYTVDLDGIRYRVRPGEYAEVIRTLEGCPQEIVIPAFVEEVPVEVIGEWAFNGDIAVSVILPDTVKKIRTFAFIGCPNLAYVSLPDSVETIEEYAFDSTENLHVLYLPANLVNPPKGIVYWSGNMLFAVLADSSAEQHASKYDYPYVRLYNDRDYIFTENGIFEIVDGEAILLGLAAMRDDTMEAFVVPDTVGGYPVTTISSDAVFVRYSLNCWEIFLGENVTTIEPTALLGTGISALYTTPTLTSLPKPLFNGQGAIYGEKGSYAERYAAANNIKFTVIGSIPFADVPENAWYYDAVKFCYKAGLMSGVSETAFNPLGKTTRAMLVTVLWRMCGAEYHCGECPYFADVADHVWYSDAISWAAEHGIVAGTSKTTFSPNSNVTREQVAAILFRFAELIGADVSRFAPLDGFKDANKVSDWAKNAMMWAVEIKIISGTDKGELNPRGYATRAEIATILMSFLHAMDI